MIDLKVKEYLDARANNSLLSYNGLFSHTATLLESETWIDKKGVTDPFKLMINRQIFQLINKEMVNELSKEINKLTSKPILEICAGDGYLTKSLKKKRIKCIATDDLSWGINSNQIIEIRSYDKAIKKYNPELVILCWEPYEKEYIKKIMKHSKVKYLIVIGEYKGGCTGNDSQWQYLVKELNNVSKYCLARTDFYSFDNHHTGCFLMQPNPEEIKENGKNKV